MDSRTEDVELTRFAELRRDMVENQIKRRGINDPRVLAAILEVPREQFVPEDLRDEAYQDFPLPIGLEQTISQPFTVAFMLQSLLLKGQESVLEIGTGSGYAAAVLARLARVVYTVERIPELALQASQRLNDLGFSNAHVYVADGTLGLPEHAPFDAIVVTASAEDLPFPYPSQLSEGGRIVMPMGGPSGQSLIRFTRQGNRITQENLGQFTFVPLIGEYGWSEPTL